MLRKIALGLVVLALLAGCTGYALPETGSATRPEEDMPLADQQALAEFQLEASGEIGVTDQPAVPAPVEPEPYTYWDYIMDLEETTWGVGEPFGEAAVPASVEPEPYTYWDFIWEVERAKAAYGKPAAVPAPVEEIDPYWDYMLYLEDPTYGKAAIEPAVPAPVEPEPYTYWDYIMDLEETTWGVGEPFGEAAVPAPVEPEPYTYWDFVWETEREQAALGKPASEPAVPAPAEDMDAYFDHLRYLDDPAYGADLVRAVPASEEPKTFTYSDFTWEVERAIATYGKPAVPAPAEDMDAYIDYMMYLEDPTYTNPNLSRAVLAPTEPESITYWDSILDYEVKEYIETAPAVPTDADTSIWILPYEEYLLDEMTYIDRTPGLMETVLPEAATRVEAEEIWGMSLEDVEEHLTILGVLPTELEGQPDRPISQEELFEQKPWLSPSFEAGN